MNDLTSNQLPGLGKCGYLGNQFSSIEMVRGNYVQITVSPLHIPEAGQELHDGVVVSHVPAAFGHMHQIREDFPLLLHGTRREDQPRYPGAHLENA